VMRVEKVAGEMEKGSRWPCSRVWRVHKIRQRRDGGGVALAVLTVVVGGKTLAAAGWG